MEMIPIRSSFITAIGYDPSTLKMRVQFKTGGLYEASNISDGDYKDFAEAKSKGTYWHQHLKHLKDNDESIWKRVEESDE